MRWLLGRCEFEMIEVDTDETLKGRPLTLEEFERMLDACNDVCRDPDSWRRWPHHIQDWPQGRCDYDSQQTATSRSESTSKVEGG